MMHKITLFVITLMLIPAVACGNHRKSAPAVEKITIEAVPELGRNESLPQEAPDLQTPSSNGSFGDIRVHVGDDWVNIHGEETRARMDNRQDPGEYDEEVTWGEWSDWIRKSN